MPQAGQRTCRWRRHRCIPRELASWRCQRQATAMLRRSGQALLGIVESKKLHWQYPLPVIYMQHDGHMVVFGVEKSPPCSERASTTDNRASVHVGSRMSEGKMYQVKSGGTAQPPRYKEAPKCHPIEPGCHQTRDRVLNANIAWDSDRGLDANLPA